MKNIGCKRRENKVNRVSENHRCGDVTSVSDEADTLRSGGEGALSPYPHPGSPQDKSLKFNSVAVADPNTLNLDPDPGLYSTILKDKFK